MPQAGDYAVTSGSSEKSIRFVICIGLVLAVFVAYEPVRHNDFVEYDDNTYVTKNPNVNAGLTSKSVIWAFTEYYAANWHPLTWLSHALDCKIYGLKPLGHHITSVLLHIATTLLLFWVLLRMTSVLWRSAFVAALFALHPVHVESVAWAAERKDVLSAFFWMLTILAYIRYVERANIKSYLVVLLCFALGLLSKPMVVTLSFVLLLLDYWPLKRFKNFKSSILNLLLEKIPFFALSAASSIITFVVQQRSQAVAALEVWPMKARIINALGCYLNYVVKMAWPTGLAVLYPAPKEMRIDSALLTIMAVAVLLIVWARGRGWLTVGLLWYLGVLIPVIGLVHVGAQIMADRYTYLPSIGIFIIVAWGAAEVFSKWRYHKPVMTAAAAAILVAFTVMTRVQVGYWQDSFTLFERAIAVTKNNFIMQNNLGGLLAQKGRYDEALAHFRESARISPNYTSARQNICLMLVNQKRFDDAITCLAEALQERPDWPDIHEMYNNLGWAYEQKGNLQLAELNYRKALIFKSDYPPAIANLASLLKKQGKLPDQPNN